MIPFGSTFQFPMSDFADRFEFFEKAPEVYATVQLRRHSCTYEDRDPHEAIRERPKRTFRQRQRSLAVQRRILSDSDFKWNFRHQGKGQMPNFRKAVIISVTAFSWLILAGQIDASDPCNPDRKFCGRLLILIAGAGATAGFSGGVSGVDADLTNEIAYYTNSNFHQFRRNNKDGMLSYSIVIISDHKLTSKLKSLPQSVKEESGFLGTVPASYDSFQELLSTDSKISLIEKAIDNFSKCPDCQQLMKEQGFTSVLPLLKTEIVVEAENTNDGIPLWSEKSQHGNASDWVRQNDSKRLDKELIEKLREKLGESVVQTFMEACNGTNIAEHFQTADQCSCYLSVTGPDTILYVGAKVPPFFAGTMEDRGRGIRSLKDKSVGARSMALMGAKLYSSFEAYASISADRSGLNPIFASGKNVNPLHSFLYNSADLRTEKILKKFQSIGIAGEVPNSLLNAGFTEALPPKIDLRFNRANKPELKRVLENVAIIRNSYTPFTADVKLPIGDNIFATEMQKFRSCASSKV